ncbi:MAG: PPC domain-containing DNA-binding protein [Erysipelotrichaceae bacterium]
MNEYAMRLTKGDDLYLKLKELQSTNNISAGCIISSVGCLDKLCVRCADGKTIKEMVDNFEILSLNGTLSLDGIHVHICVSDRNLVCFGGHLVPGCLVNTTCELVVVDLGSCSFNRQFDSSTGYDELIIKNIKKS